MGVKQVIKLKKLLNEKQELSNWNIQQIAKQTDKNLHTGARMTLARALGDKKLLSAYEGLGKVEDILAGATEIIKARTALDKKLLKLAKSKFTNYGEISKAL